MLFAHAMTGGAVASLAIIAAPHLETLLRCIFHGRGGDGRGALASVAIDSTSPGH